MKIEGFPGQLALPRPPAPSSVQAPPSGLAPISDRVELATAPSAVTLAPTSSVTETAATIVATAPPSLAGAAAGPHAIEVVKRLSSPRWGWVEHLRDRDSHFVQRTFHPRQTIRDDELSKAFGTTTPHSGDAVLMYAGDPPPTAPHHDTPVILVHGAAKNAQFWWDPKEDGSGDGLPQTLREQGYHVYAVSFAHNQDDNLFWSQQVSNAIERVKQVEGTKQVDLIGHSKGGVPVRTYLSSFGEPWMTKYQGDVRRAVFVASPLGGIDFSFRHPSVNYALYEAPDDPHFNAPMSWDRMIAYGWWRDVRDEGFSAQGPDYWPGQRQILARWDTVHPLSSFEPDVRKTYEGGNGFVSQSRGMQAFIGESGNFMLRLRETPIDPNVEVAILAGDRPNVPGILNEKDGPSDGILFLRSALEAPVGARIVAEKVFPLHHKAVVSEPAPQHWIADVLGAESMPALSASARDQILETGLANGEKLLREERGRNPNSSEPIIGTNVAGVAPPIAGNGPAIVPGYTGGSAPAFYTEGLV